ncbi:hypothetical protein LTR34_009863 [Exophiala xenobiotica]|nr:hypothetical protein LTR34_009863 [Exophiala xenobiotica]
MSSYIGILPKPHKKGNNSSQRNVRDVEAEAPQGRNVEANRKVAMWEQIKRQKCHTRNGSNVEANRKVAMWEQIKRQKCHTQRQQCRSKPTGGNVVHPTTQLTSLDATAAMSKQTKRWQHRPPNGSNAHHTPTDMLATESSNFGGLEAVKPRLATGCTFTQCRLEMPTDQMKPNGRNPENNPS